LANGALFIGTILPALGFADNELRLLLTAFTLHDAQLRSPDDFDTLWERHRLGELVEPLHRELVRTLGTPNDRHSRTEDPVQRLLLALTAANIHPLSPSFDEIQHKQQLCELLQKATGLPLVLSSHRICEDLGSFSALAHTAASRVMARHGATEVWVYPEGSWYLGTSKPQVSVEELRTAWLAAREEALGETGIGLFVDSNITAGFKLDPKALERWSDEAVAIEMADYVLRRDPSAVRKKLEQRRQGKPLGRDA
jgi:hypothetical protein